MKPNSVEPVRNAAPVLSTDRSAACQQWLRTQQQALLAAMHKVRRSRGDAAVHAARVAARRMRAVLHSWGNECHPLLLAELRFELRNLGRTLAPVREADVRHHLVAELLRTPPAELEHVATLTVAGLDQQRAAAHHALRNTLRTARWMQCLERIQAITSDQRLFAVSRPTDTFADEADDLRKFIRKFRKQLAGAVRHRDKLHALRIRAKALRYRAEAIGELSDDSLDVEIGFLRRIQTVLGDLHDCQQLEAWRRDTEIDAGVRALLVDRLEALMDRHRKKLAELRSSHCGAKVRSDVNR